jgi:putative redox protein
MKITTTFKAGMHFEALDSQGQSVQMDGAPEFGGQEKGIAPKKLMLASLAGCTGMDVVSILRKMRISFDTFSVYTDADLAPDHPQVFTAVRIEYRFTGKDLPADKIEKAVSLSQEKYCGVSAMLKKVCPIYVKITID